MQLTLNWVSSAQDAAISDHACTLSMGSISIHLQTMIFMLDLNQHILSRHENTNSLIVGVSFFNNKGFKRLFHIHTFGLKIHNHTADACKKVL